MSNASNKAQAATKPKSISVALQGGGAHGAFAWGVMDRLLEHKGLNILGVSGTSAGGMNAASVVQGLIKGGPELARVTLKDYWHQMSAVSKKISPYKASPANKKAHDYNLDNSFGYKLMGMIQGSFSPYDINPHNKNPFEDFVRDFFDFKAMREDHSRRVFLGATHVATGKVKVFSNADMCADVMMASACLPFMFQAVQVDGENYWDGGFIANPAIFPLINETDTSDIVVVQLTKTHRKDLPKTQFDIVDRLKEITYNGCLVHEMRAIHFISRMIDEGKVKEGAMKRINVHVIKNEDLFDGLNLSSALNTDIEFLEMLREGGYKAADIWLRTSYEKIGKSGSLDEAMFADYL